MNLRIHSSSAHSHTPLLAVALLVHHYHATVVARVREGERERNYVCVSGGVEERIVPDRLDSATDKLCNVRVNKVECKLPGMCLNAKALARKHYTAGENVRQI